MSQTSQQSPLRMKVLGLSADAWRLAGSQALTLVERDSGRDLSRLRLGAVEEHLEGLTNAQSSSLWGELVECGIAAGPDALVPAWAAAIVEAGSPRLGLRLVSAIPGMSMVSDITLAGERGMSVTRRHRLGEGPVGQAEVIADDANIEVALFRAEDVWFAARRVLPPIDALRADPHFTRPADRQAHQLSDEVVEQFRAHTEILSLESAGEVLAATLPSESAMHDAAVGIHAEVSLAVLATPRLGGKSGLALRLWTLGDRGLYAVNSRPRSGPVVTEVEPGAIGADIVWLVTGALEHLAAAGSAGAGAR